MAIPRSDSELAPDGFHLYYAEEIGHDTRYEYIGHYETREEIPDQAREAADVIREVRS